MRAGRVLLYFTYHRLSSYHKILYYLFLLMTLKAGQESYEILVL